MDKRDVDEVVMVGGSSRIPKIQQMVRGLLNREELCMSINPDEVVACRAAIQAAILSGRASENIKNLVLNEVTTLSLGMGFPIVSVAIPRNSSIPTSATLFRTTREDNWTCVNFSIYEGERGRSEDNKLLGKITLKDIQAAPIEVPLFEVCFDLEAYEILNVIAKDRNTGQQKRITLGSGRSSGEEIETMLKKAKMHRDEDEKVREKYDAKIDLLHYTLDRRDDAQKLCNYGVKRKDEDAVAKVSKWMDAREELIAKVSEYQEQKKQLMLTLQSQS